MHMAFTAWEDAWYHECEQEVELELHVGARDLHVVNNSSCRGRWTQ